RLAGREPTLLLLPALAVPCREVHHVGPGPAWACASPSPRVAAATAVPMPVEHRAAHWVASWLRTIQSGRARFISPPRQTSVNADRPCRLVPSRPGCRLVPPRPTRRRRRGRPSG